MPLTRPKAHQLSGQSAKSSVRVVTTSNITLSGGAPATVDGVSLTLEDRVLVTAQTDATENGIYRVTSVGSGSNGTWVRGRDANQNEEVLAGMTCMVSEGTIYADTFWKLTTDGAVTLGTTELVFEQHSTVEAKSIANLSDVTISSLSSNDVLTYNGSAWVNNTAVNLSGNITGGNLLTGNVTVSDATITVDNVTYTGTDGTTGQALLTYGNGVTYFGNVATDSGATYTTGNTAPVSPSVGDKWFDTDDEILFEYINDGTSNVWVDTTSASTGDSTTGDYAITGDLTAGGNVATGNVTVTDSTITATGNITGGNVISSGSISAGGNYLSSQPTFRNLIINGDMRIDQRNGGSSVDTTSTGNSTYSIDRWAYIVSVVSKFTLQQSSDAPTGFNTSLLITSSSAYSSLNTDYLNIRQMIEGVNFAHLGWGTAEAKTVTLSFWVKSSLTGSFSGSLQNSAFSRSYPFEYTISSANTWEQKSITIAGDTTGTWLTTNGIGCRLNFNVGTGSDYLGTADSWSSSNLRGVTGTTALTATNGATLYITGVQLEVGSTATPFEHRPYDMELQRCLRYFEKSDGVVNGSSGSTIIGRCNWVFKVKKRATPTITEGGGSAKSGVEVTSTDLYGINRTGGNQPVIGSGSTANAEL